MKGFHQTIWRERTLTNEVMEKFPSALKLQVVPEDVNLWKLENFETFLKVRREMLAKELNQFLSSITVTEYSTEEMPIDELILEGENNVLEFKSSLRWNYETAEVDKKLELVILKSVSAFGNSDGGNLIIGVNDAGEMLGLEHDYRSLEGDKDEFERHIRNLFNSNFGKVYASEISIKFPVINGEEICQISIPKSDKPLYLEVIDRSGQKQKKFYVRSGNTSQDIGLSEISEYINMKFKKHI
jgi:predicted HTH transcriptional regulator